jgi:hypothetical protein
MSRNWLLATFSALGFGVGVYGLSAEAAIPPRCEAMPNPQSRAECACEWALGEKTVVAIEEFIAKYGNEDTECNALASVPQIRPDNDPAPPAGGSPG